MKTKTIVLAFLAVTAGVFAYTRPHTAMPADLRDAVADSAAEQLGYDKSAAASVPMPVPAAPVTGNAGKNGELSPLPAVCVLSKEEEEWLRKDKNPMSHIDAYYANSVRQSKRLETLIKSVEAETLECVKNSPKCSCWFHVSKNRLLVSCVSDPDSAPARLFKKTFPIPHAIQTEQAFTVDSDGNGYVLSDQCLLGRMLPGMENDKAAVSLKWASYLLKQELLILNKR